MLKHSRSIGSLITTTVFVVALSTTGPIQGKGKPGGRGGGGGGDGLANPAFVCVRDERIALVSSNGAVESLTKPKGKQIDLAPAWSPDPDGDSTNGHQGVIAFLHRPDRGKVWSDLYTIRPDGSQRTLIRSFDSRDVPVPSESDQRITLTWAPDGSRIVYAADSQLWSVDLDGNLQLVLDGAEMGANRVGDPAFSADMDLQTPGYQGLLAFHAAVQSQVPSADIWTVTVDIDSATGSLTTGALSNVTNAPYTWQSHPAWSPDGTALVFHNLGEDGYFNDVVLFDIVTGNSLVLFVTETSNSEFTWSPDGELLAFDNTENGNWDLYVTSPWDINGPIINVSNSPSSETQVDWNPAWISDS